MDRDDPRNPESMSMDVDDGTASCRYSPRSDSAEMDSPGPSGGWMPSSLPLPSHPPGSDGSPPLVMLLSSSSPVNLLEAGDIYPSHGLEWQRRGILPSLVPSVREIASRKRKHSDDVPHPRITEEEDAFTTGANPQSSRRTRPRLRARQDMEFSPLLIMPLGQERDPTEEEETILTTHYPPNETDPPHSIRPYFHLGNPGSSILPSSSSLEANDLEDRKERGRSGSASSFAEVALASAAPPKRGRLSTLQDLALPRPFEENGQPSSGSIVAVHERGLDAGPLFLSTKSGRAGSPLASSGSPRSAMLSLEPITTTFFDRPICESPESIGSDEDGLRRYELPTIQVTQVERGSSESTSASHGRRQ